ncbi:mechanosensitive ion channel family protein [Aureimonas sp. Leaf454]|uniref:mechanosensitive ion channel family protein n=1 Tax=Aureimonas sp. Leaf454 TaxID=1736381 RepID=UPI000AD35299|nr:mechanosensitive ion channel family protein [Aureimonas sp. Leaf454]
MRFGIVWLVAATLMFCGLSRPASAQDVTAPPAKVQQLIDLLNDPEVRSILAEKAPQVASPATPSLMAMVTSLDSAVRTRFTSLGDAVARFPSELRAALVIVAQDINVGRPGTVVAILAVLVVVGFIGETLVRRAVPGPNRGLDHMGALAPSAVLLREILPLLVFIALTVGTFLSFGWPALLRRVVLTYLFAFITLRALMATARLLAMFGREAALADPDAPIEGNEGLSHFWHRRSRAFLGFFLFAWATVNLLPELGFSAEVVQLIAYAAGVGLLAIASEAVWHRPMAVGRRVPATNVLLTLYLGLLWLVWVAGFYGLLWLGIYLLILPPILSVTGRAAAALAGRRGSDTLSGAVINVLFVRGVRALVIALAIGWLAYVWRFSVAARSGGERFEAVVDGVLQGLVILLVADVLWQVCKAIIERQVQTSDATISAAEAARKSRLRTLLPLFRNTLAVFIAVVTVLTVLSGLGIAIGPLIAGAGIFGVAIGFGSQTLVKDILSGVFFMLDDAFRVGEYIQSGSYKGTVESFSLRSVRLRHHRGPIFTVPFGDLGAVQNMSRDWVIDKMTINVTYDTDVDLARRLIKKVGQELAVDPEFAANTIEPLKMQGVESFGDFAIVLRMKLMTKPGEQFRIKRKAFVMIKKSFDENGIKIATPTVQVSGDDKGAGPAASEAMRMRKNLEAQTSAAEPA